MKCDQDLCLNLWYDLKKLLCQDELNPRVRCFDIICSFSCPAKLAHMAILRMEPFLQLSNLRSAQQGTLCVIFLQLMTLIVRCRYNTENPEKQDEHFPFSVYLSFPPKCRWSIGSCRISYHFHELGEILNGCLVKERKFVYSGARRGSAKGQPNSNRTSCSLACREKKVCNLFQGWAEIPVCLINSWDFPTNL